jgi:tRNA (guanine37-N1)-methyltransferase
MKKKLKTFGFYIITLFPQIFDSYFKESILKRALQKKLIKIKIYNLRDFAKNKHKKVDDRPYGGGAGMLLMAEPILLALDNIFKTVKKEKLKIVILSAKGKQLTQKTIFRWSRNFNNLVIISGRYEGIDERVRLILRDLALSAQKQKQKISIEEISIGPYVLTDGDAPAMVIVSALTRLLPGVINKESLKEESFFGINIKKQLESSIEYPQYTRPEILVWRGKKYPVPKVLLSGNHQKIFQWRQKKCFFRSKEQ